MKPNRRQLHYMHDVLTRILEPIGWCSYFAADMPSGMYICPDVANARYPKLDPFSAEAVGVVLTGQTQSVQADAAQHLIHVRPEVVGMRILDAAKDPERVLAIYRSIDKALEER